MLRKLLKVPLKIKKAVREGGIILLISRSLRFFSLRIYHLYLAFFYKPKTHNSYKDILFINGCTLKHPSRYRVEHQIEQLEYFGFSSDQIFREHLSWRHLHLYRGFVFFRCPANEFLEEFSEEAHKQQKPLFFDIDDLIYDTDYVKKIDYVKQLEGSYLEKYIDDVTQMGKMLEICDYGITTTSELSSSMLERLPDVMINRNVASTAMFDFSEAAYALNHDSKYSSSKVRIGYLSGSITHNPDLALIQEALVNLAKKNSQIVIVLVGLVNPSNSLFDLGDQLELVEFSNWKKLPDILSRLDINIAPLEDTRFNKAKSENKWLEAALVRVPTIASNVGSFKEVINDEVDGYLCDSLSDWERVLSMLASNKPLIKKIGDCAYERVVKECLTQKSGGALVEYISKRIKPLYVFVVPTLILSGGMRVILKHAAILKRSGVEVLIYVDSDDEIQELEYDGESFSVIGTREILLEPQIDTIVATLWTTVSRVVSQIKSRRKVYLVQNYEVDFYLSDRIQDKIGASKTYCLGDSIEYLTISKWCQSWLKELYDVDAKYLPNGIDISNFKKKDQRVPLSNDVIKILVEGNSDDEYKNVDESMLIVQRLKATHGSKIECHLLSYRAKPKDWYPVDQHHYQVAFDDVAEIYNDCDVLIKSSKVESFSYPPLEMMTTGGLAIVGSNPGNAEYTRHAENCMLYKIGDLDQAVDCFNKLVGDLDLRMKLSKGGIETAYSRDWESLTPQIVNYWKEAVK